MSSTNKSRARPLHSHPVIMRSDPSSTQGVGKESRAAEDWQRSSPNRLPLRNTFATPQSSSSSTSETTHCSTQTRTSNAWANFTTKSKAAEQKPHKDLPTTANITTVKGKSSVKNDEYVNLIASTFKGTLTKERANSLQNKNTTNCSVECLLTTTTNTAEERASENSAHPRKAIEDKPFSGNNVSKVLSNSSSVTQRSPNRVKYTEELAKSAEESANSTEESDIRSTNTQALSLTGLPKNEIIGAKLQSFANSDDLTPPLTHNEVVKELRITPNPLAQSSFQVKPLTTEPQNFIHAATVSIGSKQGQNLTDERTRDNSLDPEVSKISDINTTLTSLKQHMAHLEAKIDYLETQNMSMSRRMEDLIVRDEKRRGYGTDGVRVPFQVMVTFRKFFVDTANLP